MSVLQVGLDTCFEHFGEVLREIRKHRNLTLEALAKQLYVSTATVGRWEKNKEQLPSSMTEVHQIADVLGCDDEERAELTVAYACDLLEQRGLPVRESDEENQHE